MTPSPVAIVLSTFPADQDPAPFARALVDERLVACVNVLPAMQSIYRWQGSVEVAAEHQLVMKTSAARVDAVERRIAELHPYDVPEILILTGSAADNYSAWIQDVTT